MVGKTYDFGKLFQIGHGKAFKIDGAIYAPEPYQTHYTKRDGKAQYISSYNVKRQ